MSVSPTLVVRDVTVDDAAELIRLRAVMFESMGIKVGDPAWRAACQSHLAGLGADALFGAAVDDPAGSGLVASGLVEVHQRIPSPISHHGRVAYVSSVCVDDAWRRRGLARLVMVHLLARLRQMDVTTVDLHTTAAGEGLYRELGFAAREQPELRLQLRP